MFPTPDLPEIKINWKFFAAVVAIVAIIAAVIAWILWSPKPPQQETYKPEVKQTDGSVILERKPDAAAKPAHAVPKGYVVERVVSVTVQPEKPAASVRSAPSIPVPATPAPPPGNEAKQPATSPAPAEPQHEMFVLEAPPCPPVTVDLSLVRAPDNTRRVIASSKDGTVVGGVDIPVESARPVPEPKLWAMGMVMQPIRRTFGLAIERDLGFLRLGVDLMQRDEGSLPTEPLLRALIKF